MGVSERAEVDGPEPRPVRLLSVPARHPYVDAVRPATAVPVAPDRVEAFAPDPFLSVAGVHRWGGGADLVHLHFGYEHLDPARMAEWLAALAAESLPLVVTVHDLRNPHHDRPGRHESLLAQVVPAAAGLLTLTEGAAGETLARYGRRPVVVPHPSLVDPQRSADVVTEPGLVAVHLKSLRRNLRDPGAIVRAAALGAARAGGRLRVDLHPEARALAEVAALQAADLAGSVELVEHPRFDDHALERYLRRAHVSVLPNRWGTHSGWLELARDLGTRVVAPDCGYYTDQWPSVLPYRNNEADGLDSDSLARAVTAALAHPPPEPADARARAVEAAEVRRLHARLYDRLLARRPVRAAG